MTSGVILLGRTVCRLDDKLINPNLSESQLWSYYRWSVDPNLRRKASLLLVAKSEKSFFRRRRLLKSQGWGRSPLAAVAIKLQAQTESSLGESAKSDRFWKELLRRFPYATSTADAYYNLGKTERELRDQLLERLPAHPAALASALELDSSRGELLKGALHLARWGARWPGAEVPLRLVCDSSSINDLSGEEREVIAIGMARLGDGMAALRCLNEIAPSTKSALEIVKVLMQGGSELQRLGETLLLRLLKENPAIFESFDAAKLLSDSIQLNPSVIDLMPASALQNSPSVAAARIRLQKGGDKPLKVLHRWMDHPEIWELQWSLVREAVLKKNWSRAITFLNVIPTEKLPAPMAVRQLFWKAFSIAKLGRVGEANKLWRKLIDEHPEGYYTWRARARLGQFEDIDAWYKKSFPPDYAPAERWIPLESKYQIVNDLWQLGLKKDAWETWRSLKANAALQISQPEDLLIEGRLRMAVGDDWNGLLNLSLASVRMVGETCQQRYLLNRAQHPFRFWPEVVSASRKTGVGWELLLAVAKEESRFSPGVESSVGAIGLMQLLPETANELFTRPLDIHLLTQPKVNIFLGASYLAKLINMWDGNLLLAVASYNAGPATVSNWVSSFQEIKSDPEIWIERIPYPETRFYTKKVLGSLWSYMHIEHEACSRFRNENIKRLPFI